MAISAQPSAIGFTTRHVSTTATVPWDAGPKITLIEWETESDVLKLDEAAFERYAEDAKKNCPASKASTRLRNPVEGEACQIKSEKTAS